MACSPASWLFSSHARRDRLETDRSPPKLCCLWDLWRRSRLAGRGPFTWERHSSPGGRAGGRRSLGRQHRPRRPGKSEGPGAGRAGEGALPGRCRRRDEAAAAAPREGARASGGREARRPRWGSGPRARGRQAREALPHPPPPRRSRAGARRRGGRGRPGADPERRRVCGRRPPRARLLPPRVTRRPSARTSSIRPDRPPAPLPSITPAGPARPARAEAQGTPRGRRARGPQELANPSEERDPGEARVDQGAGATLCKP